MLPHSPKRRKITRLTRSPMFVPEEANSSRAASIALHDEAPAARPRFIDLSDSGDEGKSGSPTIKRENSRDLTEVVNHPTITLEHSKIGVVLDGPNATYNELRSQYREVFLRTMEKFNPDANGADFVAFFDVTELVISEKQDSPRTLIFRHRMHWLPRMQSAEEIFLHEVRKLTVCPANLKRKCEKAVWEENILKPAQKRLQNYRKDLELLSNIILDMRASLS